MSATENTEASEETQDTPAGEPKPRGRKAPPIPRGQATKDQRQALRPGFRDPANKKSKATKKKRK